MEWAVILFMLICLSVALFFILYRYSAWLASHEVVIGILIFLFALAIGCILVFPLALTTVFFIEGIKVARHEGMKPSNLLSLLFSILFCVYLAIWPMIGNLNKNTLGTVVYVIIGFSAVYLLSLMAMYSLSAILNLVHLKRKEMQIILLFWDLELLESGSHRCLQPGLKEEWNC